MRFVLVILWNLVVYVGNIEKKVFINRRIINERERDRQTDRQTDRQRQRDRQIDTKRQTDRQTDRYKETEK